MKRILCFSLFLLLLLSGCGISAPQAEDWGSFTPDKACSFDNRYYAVQDTEGENILVRIYTAENDQLLFSFTPARARDFWGICWERDTYNIWIQSADLGIFCYRYEQDQWLLDDTDMKPDYIVSKYD